MRAMDPVHVIDSHTEGEPTRVVLEGAPDLGVGPLPERMRRLLAHHGGLASAVTREPRAAEATVAAWPVQPHDPDADVGVLFTNAAGPLGMCGHGTIGLIATLAHLGRIGPGVVRVETPVGTVRARLEADDRVAVANVPSRRTRAGVAVALPGTWGDAPRTVHGDVAWGGNWFFLCRDHGLPVRPAAVPDLTAEARRIRRALAAAGVVGDDGAEIDHVELTGAPSGGADGRGFVLCPDGSYDRSPCGTGTSALLACLAADGALEEGTTWIQESVLGTRFEAWYRRREDGTVAPTIRGRAWITAEATLRFDATDPLRRGAPRSGGRA